MKAAHRPLSLTPGFNPVCGDAERPNRFNGFPRPENKPLKRFCFRVRPVTGLKPGVNEKPPSAPPEKQKAVERRPPERRLSVESRYVGKTPLAFTARLLKTFSDLWHI